MLYEILDLTDQAFGELIVLDFAATDKNGHAMWTCLCSCGVVKVIRGTNLRAKKNPTVSCGHVRRAMAVEACRKLGTRKPHPRLGYQEPAEVRAKISVAHTLPFDFGTARQLRAEGLSYRKIAGVMQRAHSVVQEKLAVAS